MNRAFFKKTCHCRYGPAADKEFQRQALKLLNPCATPHLAPTRFEKMRIKASEDD